MRVGIIGTGAISSKHALAYRNIGIEIAACTNNTASKGQAFAAPHGAEYFATVGELCAHPKVDYVDLCTCLTFVFKWSHSGHKMANIFSCRSPWQLDLATAREMVSIAAGAGVQLGVVSQHRFDDSTLFLGRAIQEGRLGRILQADAHVKWYCSAEY